MTEENIIACPSCLAENKSTVNFCVECGRPLGNFVNYDPINSIRSEGWAFRLASSKPNAIILIGMWLLCIPTIITTLVMVKTGAYGMLIGFPLAGIYGLLLIKVTRNYFRKETKE